MRAVLVDNYDSFTFNLFQLLGEAMREEPRVLRNDEADWRAHLERADAVVISPGPGRPEREADFGFCAELIRSCPLPLLGVCLGHQGIGWVHGGRVEHGQPVHGGVDLIEHSGTGIFAGLPQRFEAVRYHSLRLALPLPAGLEQVASTPDGVPMAIAHRHLPRWGVQFHPESVATQHGRRLLENFRDLAAEALPARRSGADVRPRSRPRPRPEPGSPVHLRWRRIDRLVDPEAAFAVLYGDSEHAFWLDGAGAGPQSRFSFIGDDSGPLAESVSYDVGAGELTVRDRRGSEVRRESVFDHLDREARRRAHSDHGLPFRFDCGFAGYLGYEMKAECGGAAAHPSPHPDAFFVLADRMVAFDHREGATYALGICEPGEEEDLERWIQATLDRLSETSPLGPVAATGAPADFGLARSRRRYLEDVAECRRLLRDGESYEVCLTNRISAPVQSDPFELYRALRRANPAPFSAYLRIGETAVLSSSPERFVSLDAARGVEAKPIKGTAPRGVDRDEDRRLAEELRLGGKTRAENLMICDLLRNDLGAVCEIGSVEVPALMEVETYETVHQLVTTVRGRLREELTAVDCVRACFPPGSMTGAPKRRTMEILDRLEGESRGIYSGAIGYFGLGGGCDLSVVIRTIVLDRGTAAIGVGGAIVLGSEPEAEYEEALLKGLAPMRAIDPGFERSALDDHAGDPGPRPVSGPAA